MCDGCAKRTKCFKIYRFESCYETCITSVISFRKRTGKLNISILTFNGFWTDTSYRHNIEDFDANASPIAHMLIIETFRVNFKSDENLFATAFTIFYCLDTRDFVK